jgi:hypothetical protein
MLQGNEALQFSFRTAGRNPEVHEQQLGNIKKYYCPLILQQNANKMLKKG